MATTVIPLPGGGGGGNLIFSWDFTGSDPLIDKINGLPLTSSGVTFDSSGAHFLTASDFLQGIPIFPGYGGVEIDVGAMSLASSATQWFVKDAIRYSVGLQYRNTDVWATYYGGWENTAYTSASEFANSTLRITEAADGKLYFYKDGVSWFTPTRKQLVYQLEIGDSFSANISISNTVIKAIRVTKT